MRYLILLLLFSCATKSVDSYQVDMRLSGMSKENCNKILEDILGYISYDITIEINECE